MTRARVPGGNTRTLTAMMTRPKVNLIPKPKREKPRIPTVLQGGRWFLEFAVQEFSSGGETLAKSNGVAVLPGLHAVNTGVRNAESGDRKCSTEGPRQSDVPTSDGEPQDCGNRQAYGQQIGRAHV